MPYFRRTRHHIATVDAYSFTPTVTDGCGTLTFSIQNPPAWASFNTSTGALTGTPAVGDVGITPGIVISVEDQNLNLSVLTAFDIEVTPDCAAPIISGTPDSTVAAENSYTFTPMVSNGCGNLNYTI
ncbi:MAG: hypothetical protein GY706_07795 [Bacteroides sp.]|nr:hypothetical protein [Bacteroides sp.]